MSAKLLQALTDENPDLQKQIGCMTGIFQLFDRHHILSPKRISGHTPKRLLPGKSHLNGRSVGVETTGYSPQTVTEKNLSKNGNENQRNSVESSRASFSSSSCSSSFSSLECNKTAQSEAPSFDRMTLLEQSSRSSPKSRNSDVDSRSNNYVLSRDKPNTYPSGRGSPDLRDVVKDSIYREARTLSVKTTLGEEPISHVLKHKDSPRPMQLSKSAARSCAVEINGRSKLPSDMNESLRVLAQLKEAPWYFNEVREPPRSSCETKDSSFLVSKDAPRFSYDGREIPRPSFDSRDSGKSTMKLRELPRLSLDGREVSLRSSNFDTKPGKSNPILALSLEKELASNKRPPSVVAKLMGLEAMPNASTAAYEQMHCMETNRDDDRTFDGERNIISFSKISKAREESKRDRSSQSPRSSFRDPISPRSRNPDLVMKPISSSRFPIETAPWRQPDHSPRKTALRNQEVQARPPTPISVYIEIEKRLKELEFQQSGKDRRALKQILDAIQAKGLLEKKRGEDQDPRFQKNVSNQNPVGLDQNPRLANRRNMQNNRLVSSPIRETSTTPRSFDSPIVIMKPAKSMDRYSVPTSSVIPSDEFSGARKVQTGDSANSKRVLVATRLVKCPTSKVVLREPITPDLVSGEKKTIGKNEDNTSQKPRTRSTQISSRPPPSTKESTSGSSTKSSGSLSPRLQLKKVDLEKRSRLPIPSADSSKPRRQPLRRQSESGSPGGRHRLKVAHAQQNDDQSSEISSDTRNLSYHGDEVSVQSDSNISLASQMDTEVTSTDRSVKLNFFQPSNRSPAQRAGSDMVSSTVQMKSFPSLGEDGLSVELTIVTPEQPSPVSVLDASFYKDDLTPSPVKILENPFKDDEPHYSDGFSGEESWNPTELDGRHPDLSSEINHKKLENIERLVQKLRRLNSAHDEVAKDHIALLCENSNPDHRYVSEILLASGLLLKDLSSGPTQIQLHPSGQPINPDLFLVLEQTKISCNSKTEPAHDNVLRQKPDKEKLYRKLLFDTVNEILIQKLALTSPQPEPWLQPSKLAGLIPSGQRLLKELCLEIDRLQHDSLESSLDDNDDWLKFILREDVMHQAESWKDFRREVSSMVLDIERSIFKDLVAEIVNGESSSSLRTKPSRRRRQLFAK